MAVLTRKQAAVDENDTKVDSIKRDMEDNEMLDTRRFKRLRTYAEKQALERRCKPQDAWLTEGPHTLWKAGKCTGDEISITSEEMSVEITDSLVTISHTNGVKTSNDNALSIDAPESPMQPVESFGKSPFLQPHAQSPPSPEFSPLHSTDVGDAPSEDASSKDVPLELRWETDDDIPQLGVDNHQPTDSRDISLAINVEATDAKIGSARPKTSVKSEAQSVARIREQNVILVKDKSPGIASLPDLGLGQGDEAGFTPVTAPYSSIKSYQGTSRLYITQKVVLM
jgi:hypothetical protein